MLTNPTCLNPGQPLDRLGKAGVTVSRAETSCFLLPLMWINREARNFASGRGTSSPTFLFPPLFTASRLTISLVFHDEQVKKSVETCLYTLLSSLQCKRKEPCFVLTSLTFSNPLFIQSPSLRLLISQVPHNLKAGLSRQRAFVKYCHPYFPSNSAHNSPVMSVSQPVERRKNSILKLK